MSKLPGPWFYFLFVWKHIGLGGILHHKLLYILSQYFYPDPANIFRCRLWHTWFPHWTFSYWMEKIILTFLSFLQSHMFLHNPVLPNRHKQLTLKKYLPVMVVSSVQTLKQHSHTRSKTYWWDTLCFTYANILYINFLSSE